MSDQQEQGQEQESTDSAAVQAALRGIPGLADALGNQPARKAPSASEEDAGEPEPQFGTSKAKVEDSETVQQALRQLGLQ